MNQGLVSSAFARIEGLIAELERVASPEVESATRSVVAAVLDLHGVAFAEMLESAPPALVEKWTGQPLLASLLLLHNLHPHDLAKRVETALQPHRALVESYTIENTVVRVKLLGPEGRELIERAITDAAPDATLELSGSSDAFVSAERLKLGRRA